MNQYINNSFNESTRDTLLKYQPDGNFEKLWRRELDILATCRSYEEIEQSDLIDPIIKLDFFNDLEGFYMTFVDARGGEFLLSDIYPTLEVFPIIDINIHLHCILPLSPTRMLLLNHIMFKKEYKDNSVFKNMAKLSKITGEATVQPKCKHNFNSFANKDSEYIYKVRKVYAQDIEYINALILNETKIGVIFRNAEKIIESVKLFNERNDTKQKFLELEKQLYNVLDSNNQ